MKKIEKSQKIIWILAIILIVIILTIVITSNIVNNRIESEGYAAITDNVTSNLVASYIKSGITIGGITGTLEILDTNDATATSEDIAWGKTGYVKGKKITGTRVENVAQAIESEEYFQNNKYLKDDLNNTVVVPKGFRFSKDSATIVEDGIVIEDKNGNQFVWIPAKTGEGITIHTTLGDNTIIYKRTPYNINFTRGEIDGTTKSEIIYYSVTDMYNRFIEAMQVDEKNSVDTYGGYYIGRFEMGDKESTESKVMRSASSGSSNTVTVKKNQAPYNYITYSEGKNLVENMSNVYGYDAITKLVSSYAWDTAISFMQLKNSDYGASSQEGNYIDTSFNYYDIEGTEQTKQINEPTLIPTGQTTAVCNIYDMGGNCYERTTELIRNSPQGSIDVVRGYSYADDYLHSSGLRGGTYGEARMDTTYRITLFL